MLHELFVGTTVRQQCSTLHDNLNQAGQSKAEADARDVKGVRWKTDELLAALCLILSDRRHVSHGLSAIGSAKTTWPLVLGRRVLLACFLVDEVPVSEVAKFLDLSETSAG